MKRIADLLLIIFYSFSVTYFMYCNRDKEIIKTAYFISNKYTGDTTLLRVDTLWRGYNLGAVDIAKIKAEKPEWILFCSPPLAALPDFILEKRFYLIIKN